MYVKKGGRLLVISFHSIEDRLVKHHFRDLSKVDTSLSGKGSPDYRLHEKAIKLERKYRPTEDLAVQDCGLECW